MKHFLTLVLAATTLAMVWGCVATRADDRYKQRQEQARQNAVGDPATKSQVRLDEHGRRGNGLFNGKALCFACHGADGDIKQGTHPSVAKLDPPPTDLREPSDKSLRQLYFIIRYGIPNTGMVPGKEPLRDDEMLALLSYLVTLQGKALSQDQIFDQIHQLDGEADRAIFSMCEHEAIGDSDARAACTDRYAKRYRDLLVGRPPDIPKARYEEIKAGCKERFGTDLDEVARCYRSEYALTRMPRT